MQTGSKYGVCPTCGQSLVDHEMQKRVDRAQLTLEKAVRAKLQPDIEATAAAKSEAKHAAETARFKKRIDQLQRQVDTSSAHDRGTGHERDVLGVLRTAFPGDRIERDGHRGDILHTVVDGGRDLGLILYECKNAGNWQNTWISKLKKNAPTRGTPYVVLVSRTLPANEHALCVRDTSRSPRRTTSST